MTDTDRMVAWLREAMDAAERIAQATTPVPKGKWVAVRDKHDDDNAPLALIQGHAEDDYSPGSYKSGLPVIAHAAEWQDEAEANLRHIALHDPAAVLRRIAADRKTLDDCDDVLHDFVFGAFRQLAYDTIRNLAEGYGWTEEAPHADASA